MLDKENNVLVVEKVLIILYSIDVKLNDAFKNATIGLDQSSALFKAIFKPLQTHCVNTTRITSVYGTATMNMSFVKDGMNVMTDKLQFHHAMEERMKHIRQINTDMIQELVTKRRSGGNKQSIDACLKLVTEINAAQLTAVASDYRAYWRELDEELNSIVRYLSDINEFTKLLGASTNAETLLLIQQNAEMADKIELFIGSFRDDHGYCEAFYKTVTEVGYRLSHISTLMNTSVERLSFHPRIKQLERLYTTKREREIFKSLINSGNQYEAESPKNFE
jgi:hypothetical protein